MASPQPRDAQGQFISREAARARKVRSATLSIGGAMLATGAAIGVALWRGWLHLSSGDGGEHGAPDLAADAPTPGTDGRAPEAFRPDPTAPVPDSERDALRPATGPSPTLTAERGELAAQTTTDRAG